jgi:hypothetical protein
MSSNRGNPIKALVLHALPKIIENAPIYSVAPDRKGRPNLQYAYAASAVEIGGETYAVRLAYRVSPAGDTVAYQLDGYEVARPGGITTGTGAAETNPEASQPSPDRSLNV